MASEDHMQILVNVDIEDVVTKAMEELMHLTSDEEIPLLKDPSKLADIRSVVKHEAEIESLLNRKMLPLMGKASAEELESAMASILSPEQIQLIKDAFLLDTYQVEVYTCSKPGPNSYVRFLREGSEFFPDMRLVSSSDVLTATWIQWASVLIELIMLVCSCVGIKVSLNSRQMRKVSQALIPILEQPAFSKALQAFSQGWKNSSTSYQRAKVIFVFIKDSAAAGLFWKVAKLVFYEMGWKEYARAFASLSATLVAAFATGGAAIIAKILLALDSAVSFIQKMTNLEALEEIQKKLE